MMTIRYRSKMNKQEKQNLDKFLKETYPEIKPTPEFEADIYETLGFKIYNFRATWNEINPVERACTQAFNNKKRADKY